MALDDNIVEGEARLDRAQRAFAKLKGDVGRSKDKSRCQKPIADGFSLDARVALDERVAEQWLALRYRWDLQVLRGYRPVTPNHSGAYRLRNPRRLLVQRRPHIEALHIGEWSRFGNSVRQLLNAFFLAEELGAHTIGFPRPHLLLLDKAPATYSLPGMPASWITLYRVSSVIFSTSMRLGCLSHHRKQRVCAVP